MVRVTDAGVQLLDEQSLSTSQFQEQTSFKRAMEGELSNTIEAIDGYAAERGLSMLQVAIGGLAAQPAVTSVIAGATSAEQVQANAAAGTWEPSAEDLAALDDIL